MPTNGGNLRFDDGTPVLSFILLQNQAFANSNGLIEPIVEPVTNSQGISRSSSAIDIQNEPLEIAGTESHLFEI